jgi:hypothetical protein
MPTKVSFFRRSDERFEIHADDKDYCRDPLATNALTVDVEPGNHDSQMMSRADAIKLRDWLTRWLGKGPSAITASRQDVGHLPHAEIIDLATAPDFERFDIEGAQAALRAAFGDDFELTSDEIARRFVNRGMADVPAAFQALRAGEALGQGLDLGTVERTGDGRWRLRAA